MVLSSTKSREDRITPPETSQKTMRLSTLSEGERREFILCAAADLFLERGYDGATLDALIERTGGSKRLIYELFGGKDALLEALVCSKCRVLQERIDALALEKLAPREMLVEVGLFAAEMMLSEEGVKFYRLIVQESVRNPRLGTLLYQAGIASTQSRLTAYFEEAARSGRLAMADPADAAGIFFGMVKGDLQLRALFDHGSPPTPQEIRRRVERAVTIFLKGVQD